MEEIENILETNELDSDQMAVVNEETKQYLMMAYNAILQQDMSQFEEDITMQA